MGISKSSDGGASGVRDLRAGIVGGGFMGTVHARAIGRSGATLARAAGSTPESSRRASATLGAVEETESLDELLADETIDVVHVCTPNATHAPVVRAAIKAGKHVVCEKPLAVSVEEAQDLVDRAAEAGVVTAVPFVYRFHAMAREARARVQDGQTGPLRLMHGHYLQDWLSDAAATDWRVDPAAGGASRAFGDIGVHWCDLVEFVSGHRITSLVAQTVQAFPERGGVPVTTEDGAVVMFRTDLGATGSLIVSQISPGRKNRLLFSLDGEQESLEFDQEFPEKLWIGGVDVNKVMMRGSSEHPAAAAYTRIPAGHPQGYQDCFDAFVADAYAQIAGAERPDGLPGFADGLRSAHIIDAVLRSAREGVWVEVGR